MSLIKKSDVKNHLSPRNHKGIHLYRVESQPDATGFSDEASGDLEPGLPVEESLEQPGSTEPEASLAETESASIRVTAPATSKKLQA